ncbi:amino acid adenylation domain-containing protein [Streptomyces sp. NPDC058470]|uniref:amino acid adenylation domain-containing protein n=1 Tax=Streptomyces sp. NPDC058470 TaxID=3346515 RepID=UPI003668FF12
MDLRPARSDSPPPVGTGHAPLADAVLDQARRTPFAVAVEDGSRVLEYAELERASGRVAARLRAGGVRPGHAVAVQLPRSWELICVMLGIRRAGATVVPLDRLSPPDRQRHILDDSGAVAVIHDGGYLLGAHLVAWDVHLLLSDDGSGLPAVPSGHRGDTATGFVFYTSGSTGRPKGVEVTDEGVLRLARPGYLDLPPGARYACLSNPAFDALSFEVWVPLLTGGVCVVLDDTQVHSPHQLAGVLGERRVDTLFITTALFNAVVEQVPDCFATTEQVLVGGEQLNARIVRRWYATNSAARTVLHNVYGPTEATTFALCHPIPRDFDGDTVPIGSALPGTGVLLRTEDGRTAESDEVAELLLSGAALAHGYRNLPAQTGQSFVRLPHEDGGERRWYRTGDLVRQDAEGRVTYVGRADRQVKVRGFRIEPGEVERQILAHSAVRQAYVCTRREDADRHELLAFLVLGDGAVGAPVLGSDGSGDAVVVVVDGALGDRDLGDDLSFEAYDRHLAAALPAYMRPHHTFLVAELPLNANGKVDQAALLRAAGTPWRGTREGDAPVDADQRWVLEVAEDILGVTGLRPGDRWVASGGDSLKALRFRFAILSRFAVDLPHDLVLRADFAALADVVHAPDTAVGEHRPVPTASDDPTAPATSEQERLWLLHQREPGDRSYDVPLAFRVQGRIDTAALHRAVRTLVDRHVALRTRLVPTPHGLLQQTCDPYDPWERPEACADEEWQDTADRFFSHRFDLGDARMLRAAWVARADGGLFLLHLHHVAVDGWSLNLLFHDLTDAYAAALGGGQLTGGAWPSGGVQPSGGEQAPGGDQLSGGVQSSGGGQLSGGVQSSGGDQLSGGVQSSAITPLDFARWQRTWHTSAAYERRRARLRSHYGRDGEPSPALPIPDAPGAPAARLLRTSLDPIRRSALDRRAAQLGLTRFQLLVSAFAMSVYGVTGQGRPLIATPVANRPRPEFAETVGMFANTVLLDLPMEPHRSLDAHLAVHSDTVGAVLRDQEVALADVLADRAFRERTPLFDYLFVLENTEFSALRLDDCEVRPVWPEPLGAKCALTLSVVEHESGFDCLWEHRDDIGAARAEAAAHLFRQAIDHLTDAAAPTLHELVAPYRRALPDHGQGAERAPDFATVADGFARQVARNPHAPAVAAGDSTLTYAELDAQAAELATALRARHHFPADPAAPAAVALYLQPSVEHIVALLAAARLNLTVVPLDPAYPPPLLRHVLDRADPLCVLVAPGDEDVLDAIAPPSLPRHAVTLAEAPTPASERRPAHHGLRPLYTLFTSGSTGTPKGVQVPDRTLCNLLTWQRTDGGLSGSAVTQQFSMLSFDVSFQEIYTTLCSGGLLRLVQPAWRHDVPSLLRELETGRAERIFLPYVALQLLAEHGVRTGQFPYRLREVVTAGEQLVCTDAIRRWFAGMPGACLFNHYGPTETHVVTGLCLDGDPAGWPLRPAIGRPVANAVLRVVDDGGLPVPPGVTGELLIGGLMADRCYLGDAAPHRDRFTEDPDLGIFYRTGDLARFDAQGLLHYAGRDDTQVKLGGHRLELGQVEAALLQYPGVTNAVTAVADGRLVACLQCRGEDPDPADLADHLAGLLPAYVRIGSFRRLTELPRTPSGKLDRRAALTAPGRELRAAGSSAPGLSPLEGRLAALFETVTGKAITVEQRFFDAGATSLDLMRFQLRCAGEDDLTFAVPELFEHVTLRALARLLDRRGVDSAPGTDGVAGEAVASDAPQPTGERAYVGEGGDERLEPIAVIGMAVRLPGAPDLAAFWDLITSGRRGIEHFPTTDGRVGARSQLAGLLDFDPGRFTISPHEARLMDPQQRQLLMNCVEALAHAGVGDPTTRRVGILAACGENTYFQNMLREADPAALPDTFRLALHHEKDFLATKAAYHLGLTGPAFTVQSACSSSLVGVHIAAGMLRQGDADMMLVGGVLVDTELTDGYTYRPQHIFSPDGHCRPFSADASGTVGASGTGVVVLKPLAAARRDGDTVYAVITGSGINNDGSDKLSYSAPALAGQRAAIRTALHRSGRTGADLGYVEAHGTGTRLGDPVEAAALRQAYGLADGARVALSSVKSQIGHLGAAAGVVGLVRAVLAVHHGIVPPTPDFDRLNPEIDDGPFRIPTAAEPWPRDVPRVAAVSSFGIGGTNAHLLLEQPDTAPTVHTPREPVPCLVLSGASAAAVRADGRRIANYLSAHPETYPQVLRHLQAGRPALDHRVAAVCPDAVSAVSWLLSPTATAPLSSPARPTDPGRNPQALAEAWTAGHTVVWAEGPADPPWDFPPPAFDTAEYDFPRAHGAAAPRVSASRPQRLPATDWLHQPQWTRLRRARTAAREPSRTAVVITAPDTHPDAWRFLESHYARVVRVRAGSAFVAFDEDRYEADPADSGHLAALLARVTDRGGPGVDWLHALPLALRGSVDERSLETAQWACLDTVAALSRTLADLPDGEEPRVWLLSHQAQPVTGAVRRPEAGLLAATTETPRQELEVTLRWADLPGPDPADWAQHLPDLLLDDTLSGPLLALRDGFWWHRTVQPVPVPEAVPTTWPATPGTHLVLGGTGGIGSTLAVRLLQRPGTRVVLLARGEGIPAVLRPYADRVSLVPADLATEDPRTVAARLAPYLDGLTGIVHAAGTAAGGLLARRDPATARRATAAKLRGALLVEQLIAEHGPHYAAYCSSMAALYGGVGQFDYAAANACLDAFAQYAPPGADDVHTTVRMSIGWDAWREVGMAQHALGADARHQEHLAVALTPEDGAAVFERALYLQLPHLMVNTTPLQQARFFYEPEPAPATYASDASARSEPGTLHDDIASDVVEILRDLLGVDAVDPQAPLYDLGADSLTLLELIDEVKRRYGADIDLSRLSHRVSLTEILGHVDTAMHPAISAGAAVDVEVWQRGPGPDVLCLVHPIGGDIQAYRPLVSALPDDLTVCLIADPALRDPQLPARSIADRAAHYLAAVRAAFPAPGCRLRLAGWSFGAWTALSMAALAETDDRPVHALYLLDPPPPGAAEHRAAYDEQQVDAVFARELAGNGADRLTEPGRAYAERLARCCRTNLAAMAEHSLPRLALTPATVWLAQRPVDDVTSLAPEPTPPDAWDAHLPRPVRTHRVDATHYEIVAAPHVQEIAAAVGDDLADAPSSARGAAARQS